jgi:hypothetical protein
MAGFPNLPRDPDFPQLADVKSAIPTLGVAFSTVEASNPVMLCAEA